MRFSNFKNCIKISFECKLNFRKNLFFKYLSTSRLLCKSFYDFTDSRMSRS